MGVASWLLILLGPFVGSGPVGGCFCGRAAGCCSGFLPLVVGAGCGWLPGAGIGDTPAAGGLLRLLWSWWSAGWWVPLVRACVRVGVACCRGSGAVRPGCLTFLGLLFVGGFWVGVGGLVVNCIVDASILL